MKDTELRDSRITFALTVMVSAAIVVASYFCMPKHERSSDKNGIAVDSMTAEAQLKSDSVTRELKEFNLLLERFEVISRLGDSARELREKAHQSYEAYLSGEGSYNHAERDRCSFNRFVRRSMEIVRHYDSLCYLGEFQSHLIATGKGAFQAWPTCDSCIIKPGWMVYGSIH